DSPAQLLQPLMESCEARLSFSIIGDGIHEHADPAHLRLLRARRERPRRRAAEQRYELASFHSITSSARASSVGGTSMPSAFAVLSLMTNWNLVDDGPGRSRGRAPRKMR